jgi:membrane-associated phospholipid phosphatase
MTTPRLPLLSLLFALLQAIPIRGSAAQRNAPVPYNDTGSVDKTFFTRRDAVLTGFAVLGTLAIAPFDERIANWAQSPTVQGGTTRRSSVDWLTHINETPLTLGALATYGVGRIGRMKTVADIGLHVTESLVLTDVVSEVIRGPIGRARPRVTANDAFVFHFWGGFTQFDERSFPSLHSSSAFAAASSLFGEIRERNPGATWYAGPLLFGAALVPGITRVYLNQHWASDIAAGAFIGTLLGTRVVRYAHSHRRSKVDQFLLGTTVVPLGDNQFAIGWSSLPD